MADYNSSHVGNDIDTSVSKILTVDGDGGLVSKNFLSSTLENYLTTNSKIEWNNINGKPNYLYIISKSTGSGTTITITVPGHANASYDRIMIWGFGNMNGTPYYGIVCTASGSDGSSPNASFIGSHTKTCTYANSGTDRIITINDLPSWGTMTFLSLTHIS